MKLYKSHFTDITSILLQKLNEEKKKDMLVSYFKMGEIENTDYELPDIFEEDCSKEVVEISPIYMSTETPDEIYYAYQELLKSGEETEYFKIMRCDWNNNIIYFSVKDGINPYSLKGVIWS